MARPTFLFVSALALYPPLLRVAEIIAREHGLNGQVIAPEDQEVTTVYQPAGRLSARDFDASVSPLTFHFLPAPEGNALRWGFDRRALKRVLGRLRPDYLWVHDEFNQSIALQLLGFYRWRRGPRIVAYVAHNHSGGPQPLFYRRWPFLSRTRLKHLLLWPRLDGVAACAAKARECARRLGLPARVPVVVNYLPVLGPKAAAPSGVALPWPRQGSFTVGFAGALTAQKGWKVLLAALEVLPPHFKGVIAGDGPQRQELLSWLARPTLQQRLCYVGVLPKAQLLALYPQFDVLVLPALTTSYAEQFGAVLAEAMACGVPVVGSDSGAIPETIGNAGIIVPEGDPQALADALGRLADRPDRRRELAALGVQRYHNHFRPEVYARSLADLMNLQKASPTDTELHSTGY